MAAASEKSFPFDTEDINGEYDRVYLADDFARYFRAFISSGVFMEKSTNLQVIANGDMTVTLKPGDLIIDGYRYENEDDIIIRLDPADGATSRIDRISATWSSKDRDIHYTVQKGKNAYEPTAPEARRTAEYKDYVLADVFVAAGVILISQTDITDVRLNSELCGLATAFCKVDTTEIFNQYMDWFKKIKKEGDKGIEALIKSYKTWIEELEGDQLQRCTELLETMGNILSKADAVNLQFQVDEIKEQNKILGSTEIVDIGDGTVTGAIKLIAQQIGGLTFVECSQAQYDALGAGRPAKTIYLIVG